MKTGKRITNSSYRILDAYVSGLRSEVERLTLMRENSDDALSLAQFDFQINLKLQLIDDVCQCLDDGHVDDSVMVVNADALLVLPSGRPAIA